MRFFKYFGVASLAALALCLANSNEGWTQGKGKGKVETAKASGHRDGGAPQAIHSGPAMTRPPAAAKTNISPPVIPKKTESGGPTPALAGKASGGFQRPTSSGADRPKVGGATEGPGKIPNRPASPAKPGAGASTSDVNDFLGLGGNGKPSGVTRPNVGKDNSPAIKDKLPGKDDSPGIKDKLPGKDSTPGIKDKLPGKDDSPGIKDKLPGKDSTPGIKDKLPGKDDSPGIKDKLPGLGKGGNTNDPGKNINIGNVNIGNSVDYSKDQKTWVENRHATGNQVRLNSGNRYNSAYTSGLYRRGVFGGYPYYRGWADRGPYYGWRATSYVAFGAFMGATWANSQQVYYAYGAGGNVYYENNTVYVNGTAAGSPEQYAQQVQDSVAAAPATTTTSDWLPLGAFALSREDVDDSQTMIELAVNKEGIIAGTYYNEATGVSRSLKGTLNRETQRVAIGFADGKGEKIALETGIYNLTQDEAPGLLLMGKANSQPILLVRLVPPEDKGDQK